MNSNDKTIAVGSKALDIDFKAFCGNEKNCIFKTCSEHIHMLLLLCLQDKNKIQSFIFLLNWIKVLVMNKYTLQSHPTALPSPLSLEKNIYITMYRSLAVVTSLKFMTIGCHFVNM